MELTELLSKFGKIYVKMCEEDYDMMVVLGGKNNIVDLYIENIEINYTKKTIWVGVIS
jgi:predicted RNA-binding protein associated with RNAse of E/G family